MIKTENIVEFLRAAPFKPFDIHTSGRRVYTVEHPEFVMRTHAGNVIYYITDDDRPIMIALTQIVSLEITNSRQSA